MGKRTSTASWSEKKQMWRIDVQKDNERKSFYSSKPGRTGQREANRKADAWLDDNVHAARLSTEKLLNEFLSGIQLRSSLSNYEKEKYFVDSFIRPVIGKKKPDKLTEQDLQDIINKAYNRPGSKTLSRKTLLCLKSTVVNFAKFLRRKKAAVIFYDDLTIPAGAKTKQKRILQPHDLIKLFRKETILYNGKEIFDDYIYAYRFAILTGLRPGELIGLKPEDIKGTAVYIQRAKNIHGELTTGKNDNAIRKINLTPLAYETLQAQLQLYPDAEYVFNINSQSTLRHRWEKYCEHNDISYISLYEMRHTFVSIAKQLPEGMVKPIVGHSKAMDTFGVYGHEINGDQDNTKQQLNDIFIKLLTVKNESAV